LAHTFPDAHHVAAGGIDDDAAFGFDFFARADFGAERGNDDGVAGIQ